MRNAIWLQPPKSVESTLYNHILLSLRAVNIGGGGYFVRKELKVKLYCYLISGIKLKADTISKL